MLNNNFFKSRIFLLLRRDHQADGPAFGSSSNLFFYFPIQKYFTILFKILEFLRSLDRLKVHIRVLLVSFIWLGETNSLKYLLIGGGDVCPPMPRRRWLGSCPDWLKICRSYICILSLFRKYKNRQVTARESRARISSNPIFGEIENHSRLLIPVLETFLERIS